jgi:cytochrome c551/c552
MRVGNPSFALLLAVIAGCGGEPRSADASARVAARSGDESGEQLEKGIGPVKNVELEALDPALAARGEQVFTLKCSACHKPDERYVGPALADVTTRRTPEYVMNMILNPAEMVEKHPEARKLLAEFMTPMPDQNLTQDDARAVLEYLRSLTASTDESMEN